MKVQGTYKFEAPLEKVWNALQSPEVLSNCIPGCEKFDPEGENSYLLSMRVKVASVTGKYSGKVSIKDISCLLYTSPSPRDLSTSRMPSSA